MSVLLMQTERTLEMLSLTMVSSRIRGKRAKTILEKNRAIYLSLINRYGGLLQSTATRALERVSLEHLADRMESFDIRNTVAFKWSTGWSDCCGMNRFLRGIGREQSLSSLDRVCKCPFGFLFTLRCLSLIMLATFSQIDRSSQSGATLNY